MESRGLSFLGQLAHTRPPLNTCQSDLKSNKPQPPGLKARDPKEVYTISPTPLDISTPSGNAPLPIPRWKIMSCPKLKSKP